MFLKSYHVIIILQDHKLPKLHNFRSLRCKKSKLFNFLQKYFFTSLNKTKLDNLESMKAL